MDEVYWFGYVGFFLLPFCAVSLAIYLEGTKNKARSSASVEVVVAEITSTATDEDHAPSAPTAEELELQTAKAATAKAPERPPPPPYREPADNQSVVTPAYPKLYPTIAAKTQTPRIYIHAVGLR